MRRDVKDGRAEIVYIENGRARLCSDVMRARLGGLCAIALAVMPWTPAVALDLNLPGLGALSREAINDPGIYPLPLGPWADGAIPVLDVTGRVATQAWRIKGQGMTTLQVLDPLAAQLETAGYDILFRCYGQTCGGFDFRFGTPVLDAPDMFVDLFDYRFLSARRAGSAQVDAGPEYVSILVSRSNAASYVQITHVGAEDSAPPTLGNVDMTQIVTEPDRPLVAEPAAPLGTDPLPLERALETRGHVVLRDLDFSTGAVTLGPGPFASLTALSAYLHADPARRVALVGHTDTVGGLAPNITLSRQRAAAVMERLIDAHDVPARQIEAQGMGYLSPIAPNLTPEGREANRRVEAVLLNTE
ncbi:OmpA family protein [Rhodobacteraceae bacterium KMM 6894]|nr:OmpA family protein [Rhodobacteraceae bacterium KMM 6894]